MEAVIFCGIQAAGKTTYYHNRYSSSHRLISLDRLKTRGNEKKALADCIREQQCLVIDNTNTSLKQREAYIALLKKHGYRVDCVYFTIDITQSLRRNHAREDKRPVPDVAIYTAYKNLELSSYSEGYRRILEVVIREGEFQVYQWKRMTAEWESQPHLEQIRQFVGMARRKTLFSVL